MFYQIFFSPQVKRSTIISNKHSIYGLPNKLPNDLRLRKNQENLKISSNDIFVPSLPAKMKVFLN